jgi:hypothetical protein
LTHGLLDSWLDQKRPPARTRQSRAQRRQQSAIGRAEPRASDLPPEHIQLMAEHKDLHLLHPLATTAKNSQ